MPKSDYIDYLEWLTKQLGLPFPEVVVPLSDIKKTITPYTLTRSVSGSSNIWVSDRKNHSPKGEENKALVYDIIRTETKPNVFVEEDNVTLNKSSSEINSNHFKSHFDGKYYGQNMTRPMGDLLTTMLTQKMHAYDNGNIKQKFIEKLIKVDTFHDMAFTKQNGRNYIFIIEKDIGFCGYGEKTESNHLTSISIPGYMVTVCEYIEDKGCLIDGVYASNHFFSEMVAAYQGHDLDFLKTADLEESKIEQTTLTKNFSDNIRLKIEKLEKFIKDPKSNPLDFNELKKYLPWLIDDWLAFNKDTHDVNINLYQTLLENLKYLIKEQSNTHLMNKTVDIYFEIKNGAPETKNQTILNHLNSIMNDVKNTYEMNNTKLNHSNRWIALGICLIFLTALSVIGYGLNSFDLGWNVACNALQDWATHNTATTFVTGVVTGGAIVGSYYKSELNIRDNYSRPRDASKAVKDTRDIIALDSHPPKSTPNTTS